MYTNILNYFKENEDVFNECIEQLDAWNGYLGDDRIYEMYLLDEFYQDTNPTELLNRAYFGRDDESWHTDASGRKIYDSFNPNREYFYYDGYGNLCSCNYKDYSAHLDDYFVEQLVEYRNEINAIEDNDELNELISALEVE